MKFIYYFNDIDTDAEKDIISDTNIINELTANRTEIELDGETYKVESMSEATINLDKNIVEYGIDIVKINN